MEDLATACRYMSITRQLAIIGQHGIKITKGTQCMDLAPIDDFWKLTREIVPDPLSTKQQFRIHLRDLLPLKEIGITRIADILDPRGTHIIDTNSLGKNSMRVKNRHKTALNRLTCLLCNPSMSNKEIKKINKTAPISEAERRVSDNHTELITASLHNKNTNKKHLWSPLHCTHNRGNVQKTHGHS